MVKLHRQNLHIQALELRFKLLEFNFQPKFSEVQFDSKFPNRRNADKNTILLM